MPFYEYVCIRCGSVFDTVKDYPPPKHFVKKCPFCETDQEYELALSAPAIIRIK